MGEHFPDTCPTFMGYRFIICGEPPGPGETVWVGDREHVITDDWQLRPVAQPVPRRSLGDRIAERLVCPACLLPRFVPGHKARGCAR